MQDKVFAIDFDEKAVRVGRTLNLIAGDGQTNVLHLNTLDYERWDEKTKDEDWGDIYGEGWKKLRKLRVNKDSNRDFNFDVLMANPPFAGDIKETRILAKYELGKKDNGKYQTTVGRDILFIERNLNFLKPGGRMAVVLPQGRFNNSSDKQIREYIAEHARILAVVGLHGNVFKPHTGTKTSVLLVQKWDDVLCPKVDDYPIFFATMQEPSKDNSGDKIYVKQQKVSTFEANDNQNGFKLVKYEQADFLKKYGSIKEATTYEFTLDSKQTRMNLEQIEFKFNGLEFVENPINLAMPIESNELLMDAHGHLIVKHDLFNHDGLTQDGIAEAFIEFAKKENLSFFDCGLSGSKNLTGLYAEAFDEVKYRALLESLEISEVMLSKLERTNRMDSEFYARKNIEALEKLIIKKSRPITDFVSVSDGNHMTISEYYCNDDDGIPYYRGTDIYNFFIEQASSPLRIERRAFNSRNMQRSHLKKGDVLMSIVGAIIGNLSLVKTEVDATCSCKLAIMRPHKIEPAFLAIYLKSYYGQNQIQKFKRGAAQTGLILEDFDQIAIPDFSDLFRKRIEKIVSHSYEITDESKSTYSQSETLVLNALGMAYFSPNTENINIKSFKDSFAANGRLDAEYYQPKYENYENHIFSYANGWGSLINSCNLKDSNYYPKDNRMYQYIELANIDKSGGITNCTTELGKDLPSRARRKVQSGDVLISSIEGSLSSCAIVSKAFDGALCSTGFYVIDSNKMNSETLLVLFKSELMQNILKQHCSGTILTAINKTEFSNLPIPIIAKNPQIQIADLVQQSFILKAESERLLATAKRAV